MGTVQHSDEQRSGILKQPSVSGELFFLQDDQKRRAMDIRTRGVRQKYSPEMITCLILLVGEWVSSVAYFEEIIFVDFQPNHMLSF